MRKGHRMRWPFPFPNHTPWGADSVILFCRQYAAGRQFFLNNTCRTITAGTAAEPVPEGHIGFLCVLYPTLTHSRADIPVGIAITQTYVHWRIALTAIANNSQYQYFNPHFRSSESEQGSGFARILRLHTLLIVSISEQVIFR
jgi:hypothetical protein